MREDLKKRSKMNKSKKADVGFEIMGVTPELEAYASADYTYETT
jgi:hypothetical protein